MGRPVDLRCPSVTTILDAVGLGYRFSLPPDKRDFYLARGQALHRAIELEAAGTLDPDSVHPEIAGGLEAYRKFVAATGHRALDAPCCGVHSEVELVHPAWGFCGHPDRIGPTNGRLLLVDWKASVDEFAVRFQLSGYAVLWEATHPETPLEGYAAVRLGFDGSWSMTPVDVTPYRQTFLAAVVLYRALADGRRLKEAP